MIPKTSDKINDPSNVASINISISLNESTAARLLEALSKAFSCASKDQNEEIQTLQKTNLALQEKLGLLERELALQKSQDNAKPSEAVKGEETKFSEKNAQENKVSTEPAKVDTAVEPDAETAEKWAWNNMDQWLDEPAPFAKAAGRTWRQLGQNVGSKIDVKGKPAPPRAYLHSIETWQSCKVWHRTKAKVALLVCKNGNDATPKHLAGIGA